MIIPYPEREIGDLLRLESYSIIIRRACACWVWRAWKGSPPWSLRMNPAGDRVLEPIVGRWCAEGSLVLAGRAELGCASMLVEYLTLASVDERTDILMALIEEGVY